MFATSLQIQQYFISQQYTMSQLPTSFDPFLLNDQLITTLNNSQITQQFTSIRANEIIEAIVLKPIIIQFNNQINTLKHQLKTQRNHQKTLRSHSKKSNNDFQKQLSKKQSAIQRLQITNNQLKQKLTEFQQENTTFHEQMQQLKEYCQKLQDQMQQKQQEIHTTTLKLMQYEKQNKELRTVAKNRQQQIQQLKEQIKKKLLEFEYKLKEEEEIQIKQEAQFTRINQQLSSQKTHVQASMGKILNDKNAEVQKIKMERFQIKNELNSYRIDYQELIGKKMALEAQCQATKAELSKNKEAFKSHKSSAVRQRKLLDNKLFQLSGYYKRYQSVRKKVKNMSKIISDLKNQHNKFTRNAADQIRKLYLDSEAIVKTILDHVGEKVSKDLQTLSYQLHQSSEEANISKAQAKFKEEALQRLERQIQTGSKEMNDWKNEAKLRKRQEQRLKRQLRKNFEENQVKLSVMEGKYLDLLNGMPY